MVVSRRTDRTLRYQSGQRVMAFAEILQEAGFSPAEIAALSEQQVIVAAVGIELHNLLILLDRQL